MSKDRITEINEQIADLKKRWPAHSVPPAMMEQLDTLEEELSIELEKSGESVENQKSEIFRFRAIGYVENEFPDAAKLDLLRASPARIVLAPDLLESLTGFEPGMELMVVFVFHRSEGYNSLQYPRGEHSRPQRGVLALRSPNRPNPIGVTFVKLSAIEGNVLTVLGLDAINGAPVLDIKQACR